jgi:ABC-type phosphate transport system permease subunit
VTIGFAISVAFLCVAIGAIHSWFAGQYQLGKLYADDTGRAVKRRIVTLIWHLPSITWSLLGLAVLLARLTGQSSIILTGLATTIIGFSGAGNLWAHRKPFFGGLLLLATAGLVVLDWIVNQ